MNDADLLQSIDARLATLQASEAEGDAHQWRGTTFPSSAAHRARMATLATLMLATLVVIAGLLAWNTIEQHMERSRSIALSKCLDKDAYQDGKSCDFEGKRVEDTDDLE